MSTYTNPYALRSFTGLARALADPTRVRALVALREGELCVCQLVELLGLSPSSVSRHLSVLGQSYLVDSRREGRWVYYRRAGAEAPPAVTAALEWVDEGLVDSEELRQDRARLEEILSQSVEELCRTRSAED